MGSKFHESRFSPKHHSIDRRINSKTSRKIPTKIAVLFITASLSSRWTIIQSLSNTFEASIGGDRLRNLLDPVHILLADEPTPNRGGSREFSSRVTFQNKNRGVHPEYSKGSTKYSLTATFSYILMFLCSQNGWLLL